MPVLLSFISDTCTYRESHLSKKKSYLNQDTSRSENPRAKKNTDEINKWRNRRVKQPSHTCTPFPNVLINTNGGSLFTPYLVAGPLPST
jgi:hypothetical protein